jgi:hypothetical protein
MKLKKQTLYVTPPQFISNSVRSVSSVVKPSAALSDSGSALILTLLITALLATITVSFLSTSRVEQIAARNFSRQNAASGLAELATGQAMAQIQKGFTITGNATTVITTQPGAIWQYTFSSGSCNAVATKNPVELFSGTSNASTNGTANLNNLQNPSSNATLTSNSSNNQWTITGNASQQINVPLENITSNGTVIGRIAYYVDDEGTKLNLNAAIGDRTTLNVGNSRSLSLSSLASASQAANFTKVVEGNATSNATATTDMKNWAQFFRPEQISGAVSGFTLGNIPSISAAPVQVDPSMLGSNSSSRDYHVKRTPWGTSRLFINDLPTDSANVTASVNAIYNALSDTRLRDIYGSTFANKYTDEGVKQIAANLLQARNSNTLNNWNKSFNYNGALLGAANATTDLVAIANCCNATSKVIPKDYLGSAPYPFINEVGVTVLWTCEYVSDNPTAGGPRPPPGRWIVRPAIRPFVSIANLNKILFAKEKVAEWEIQMQIDSFRYDFTYNGNTHTYGPRGFQNNDSWGHNWNECYGNAQNRDRSAPPGKLKESYLGGNGPLIYRIGGGYTEISQTRYTDAWRSPNYSETLGPGEELQFPCPPYHGASWDICFQVHVPFAGGSSIPDVELGDMFINFEYIRLVAKSGDGTTIRDWVLGEDLGEIKCELQKPHPEGAWASGQPTRMNQQLVAASYNDLFDDDGDGNKTETLPIPNFKTWPSADSVTKPPATTAKRIDGRLRTPASVASAGNQRNSMKSWSFTSAQSWPNANVAGKAKAANKDDAKAFAYETRGNDIPGDPTEKQNSELTSAYDPGAHHLDSNDWPSIEFTNPANGSGVFTSPADLGKIQTNVQHRKLRMTTQHPNEVKTADGGGGSVTYIPDWAMLDVISFGSNITTVPLPAPVNLTGRFYVPSTSPQPAPRAAGLESVLKTLDSASSLGNTFNATIKSAVDKIQYIGATSNSSAIAGNIRNLTWTTGNFTSGNSTWSNRRNAAKFPSNQIVLPAEVTEIKSISDLPGLDTYTGNSKNIKGNEGRLSALFPGVTTQSRFFTIYAYAQALDKTGAIDSEALTKTLVEVVEDSSSAPSKYTVKKLYSQKIHDQL